MRRHIIRGTLLLALGAGLTGSASCTMREGTGSSYLIIERLLGGPGESSTLRSDVGALVEDRGVVTFRLAPKDPGTPLSPSNFITINRYRVVYTRSDGRNTPGVDVPHPFDGTMTATITESLTTVDFTLVRLQAKFESPLVALRGTPSGFAITTTAQITFFGQDQTGRAASATGTISVSFVD